MRQYIIEGTLTQDAEHNNWYLIKENGIYERLGNFIYLWYGIENGIGKKVRITVEEIE